MANQKPRKGFDRAGTPAAGRGSDRAAASGRAVGSKAKAPTAQKGRNRAIGIAAGVIAALVIALGGAFMLTNGGAPTASTGSAAATGTLVQSSNGSWTNISPDMLASELQHKDFTLLNVKTPYIGEIQGTDLYIPYTDIPARASELPTDKAAKIVVYCRSGAESTVAAQELLDLGYTNLQMLDGGMNAWTASGRTLIQKNRA